ncbi:MAG: hypothetical protein O9264_08790 [Leptospira sp.]|nr:hypothetical protein [Leptospira sp.]
MALNWGVCLPGSGKYDGRKVRFAVDYGSFPKSPIIPNSIKYFNGFSHNKEKRRVSVIVNPDRVTRCDFTTKLITDDPIAENFYNEFIKANIPLFGSYQEVQKYIRFYCFDDKGLDIPFVPNVDDITSSTGLNEISKAFLPAMFLVAAYFSYPYLKKNLKKRKSK